MKARELFATLIVLAAVAPATTATAEPWHRGPFTDRLSNNRPLAFGMNIAEASAALGVPLTYIRGKPGNELLAAERPSAVNFAVDAKLFLQFRHGRLTGWKGDWERNWMWK
ncbi:hypothetical protein X566_07885 [Afipia sp. P52-10]|uniref:hypothetical protein n=1 Tax=Afipia sp. P52-10 TaxID=1429916 RepID=UPI0003DF17A2|nr:hypothetical protein [Afipia sp. P52-10]ETR77563.1 hypothetical protein X566_07885 [Afipia sp. P52-10]